MRILLIEDDPLMTKIVRRGLEQAHYTVDAAADGACGLQMAIDEGYDLILLDLMLPKMDGLQVCEALRARRRQTPILMLTARGSVPDKVRGFECGADDYLGKPFDFAELLVRVRALLRRDMVHRKRLIQIDDMAIDTVSRHVSRGGQEILLSRKEYQLLEALATNEGHVLERWQIQQRVWNNEESFSNTVDVFIGLLRKKIDVGFHGPLIHTVRGRGYMLRRLERESLE